MSEAKNESSDEGANLERLVMRQTKSMTCDGCAYGGKGIACNRPNEATHCMTGGKEFIYVREQDA